MRRGERVRFEDLMLLDRSIFFGIANIHDRHRDMRLNVDNMPYEYDDREYTKGYMYNEDRLLLPKLKRRTTFRGIPCPVQNASMHTRNSGLSSVRLGDQLLLTQQ
nr:probable E3 ubiquitin-protein ligase RHG1A isoform X1 [Tanacetum cinerariifolium]